MSQTGEGRTLRVTTSRRRLVTAAVMGGIFLSAMDLTAVAPAMPRIVAALGGGDLYAFAFSFYAVLSTTTTPVFGRLADRHGRRPVFVTSVGIFLFGSVLSGAAPTMPLFLAARAVQGVGAGGLLTTSFTIVGDLYDLSARARIQGFLSGVWGVASIVGPLVGGTLVETAGWRFVFYINIPIGLAAAHIVFYRLREDVYPREGARLDLFGAVLFSGAVLVFLVGLKLEEPWRLPALVLGAGGTVLFVVRERRVTEPLFDLGLFRMRIYRAANLCGFFAGAVLLSLTAYLPVYVMNVRGGNSILSGLMLTPISTGWVIAATISGRALLRFGYRILVIPGLFLLAAATVFISRIGPDTGWALVIVVLFLIGVSFGLSFTTFLVAVQEEVTVARRGQATSAVQFFRQIGGAIGVAVLEVVLLGHLSDPSLLEAAPGRVFLAAEKGELMAGFSGAFLAAAAFALVAAAGGFLTPRSESR